MTLPTVLLNALEEARSFGYRELADGTRLFGRVPHVAAEAWFHAVFPGLNEEQLQELKGKLACAIPAQLEQFLRSANGLSLFSGSLSLYGLRRDYRRDVDNVWQPFDLVTPNVDERPKSLSEHWLIVGGYRADGSRLYVTSQEPQVYRRQSGGHGTLNQWHSFESFLESEVIRLRSQFDPVGRRLDTRIPTTPLPD
jgi:hypothetical protein